MRRGIKTRSFNFRISDDLYQRMNKASEKMGLDCSQYLRMLLHRDLAAIEAKEKPDEPAITTSFA